MKKPIYSGQVESLEFYGIKITYSPVLKGYISAMELLPKFPYEIIPAGGVNSEMYTIGPPPLPSISSIYI